MEKKLDGKYAMWFFVQILEVASTKTSTHLISHKLYKEDEVDMQSPADVSTDSLNIYIYIYIPVHILEI